MTATTKDLFDLSGKVAIVTGGAMGIGKAISLRLAEAGAAVVVADLAAEEGSQTAEEIKANGGKAGFVRVDASSAPDIESAIKSTVDKFGRLDILVNNAGIFPPKSMLDIDEKFWDKVQAVNLKGAFFFTQAAAKEMIAEKHGGKIVNIASVDAVHPTGALAHYDASKGGVVMMTKAMALELAQHGITVNALAPGGIATPGGAATGALFGEAMQKAVGNFDSLTKQAPLGMGEPDDIAKVVLFLAGEASSYMTGSLVIVDGGLLLK